MSELNDLIDQNISDRARVSELEAQEKELRAKILQLDAERKALSESIFDRNRLIRAEQRRVEDEENRRKIAEANAKAEAERNRGREELIARAQTFPWFKDLYKHQLEGALFLASAKRAICADSMGLGKTLETAAALDLMNAQRVLVICPGEVMSDFHKTFKRWAPHRTSVVIGRKTKFEQQMFLENFSSTVDEYTFIVNYESWNRNRKLLEWLRAARFDSIVIDEAHRIKETDTVAYTGVSYLVNNDITPVDNFIALTGTPILNKPSEIYPLLHLSNEELFPNKAQFSRSFVEIGYDNKETWSDGGLDALTKKISGMYIRRTLSDTDIVLPPQEIVDHEIEITKESYPMQFELLDALWNDAQLKIDEGEAESIPSVLALITRQRQATVWPGGINLKVPVLDENGWPMFDDKGEPVMTTVKVDPKYRESAKLDAAVDLYQDLIDGGHRVVFFSQFKEVLYELKRRLGDEVVEYHGDTSPADREIIKSNFDASNNEEAKWKGILCHYKTGGVGLNLTAATATIIMDEEWNPGMGNQAYDRTHRIGQTQNTQIHILRHVGPGRSMDMWLKNIIDMKGSIVGGFDLAMMGSAFK